MKKSLALLVLVILVGCGSGRPEGNGILGENDPPPPPPPPPPENPVDDFAATLDGLTLNQFFDVSFKGLINRSPETVVGLTLDTEIPQEFPALDDFSEEYQLDTYAMYNVALDKLRTYDRATLSSAQQLNYDIYEWFLQDKVDEEQFMFYRFATTYMGFSEQRRMERFMTDLHPMRSLQDAENYVIRLGQVGVRLGQLSIHLTNMRRAGVREPSRTVDIAINRASTFATAAADLHPFITSFEDRLDAASGISADERAELEADARDVVENNVKPAYQTFVNNLQNASGLGPDEIGYGQYPLGAEYYEYSLRHHTTSNLTAAEIHQLGLDELARIHAEIRAICVDQLAYPDTESLQEWYARVEEDGEIIPATETFQTFSDLVAFAEANLPQAFDVFPMADVVVQPDPFGGFYIGPSFDGSRPGAFYAGTDFDQPYAPMPSLTFHESVPGHHLQIALAMESDLPIFRKIVRSTGFVEGWALYAERLAFELGWYDTDVFGNLGRLQFEALRAARLVIDTGIHSMGWTFDQAAQFNMDNVGASLNSSQGAAARYSVWPGQATAYMVGMLQILSERQRASDALGANFDLFAFHRALLTNGGVPLSLLPDVVDQYIADATP